MASLSEKLRRERELRGISLKQISEETKIGVRFLEALEENRVDLIPGEFYRRSYLRAYARYLGLDEERALNAYDFANRTATTENGDGIEEEPQSESVPPGWLKWALGAALLLALPASMLLKSEPSASSGAARTEAAEQSSPAAEEASVPMPGPEARSASETMPVIPEVPVRDGSTGDRLQFVLSVDESCWLEIQADGEVVTSGLKDGGFRQEVTASREVKLWLGNAGGVSVWLNGMPARALGGAGQVRKDLSITPENYREFLAVEGSS